MIMITDFTLYCFDVGKKRDLAIDKKSRKFPIELIIRIMIVMSPCGEGTNFKKTWGQMVNKAKVVYNIAYTLRRLTNGLCYEVENYISSVDKALILTNSKTNKELAILFNHVTKLTIPKSGRQNAIYSLLF